MPSNVTQTLIRSRLESGCMIPGDEIALHIDQVLLQDVLGGLVMLGLEAIGLERVKTDVAAQYIDHDLLEVDNSNAEEHLFLRSACRRFGIWYSRPGNGSQPSRSHAAVRKAWCNADRKRQSHGGGRQPRDVRIRSRRH